MTKPVGWRKEPYRHYLASQGIRSYRAGKGGYNYAYLRPTAGKGFLTELLEAKRQSKKQKAERLGTKLEAEKKYALEEKVPTGPEQFRQLENEKVRSIVALSTPTLQAEQISGNLGKRLLRLSLSSQELNDRAGDIERSRAILSEVIDSAKSPKEYFSPDVNNALAVSDEASERLKEVEEEKKFLASTGAGRTIPQAIGIPEVRGDVEQGVAGLKNLQRYVNKERAKYKKKYGKEAPEAPEPVEFESEEDFDKDESQRET